MSRGAGNHAAPITYEGEYDPDRTYLPRQIVTVDGVPYMATALVQGVTPAGSGAGAANPILYVGLLAPTDGRVFWWDVSVPALKVLVEGVWTLV